MIKSYGEIAALLTAVCWSFNSVVFSLAGKRVGSVIVNKVRLWVAVIALFIIHFILYKTFFPFTAAPREIFFLAISGVIGFIIGDSLLFESFLLIGPRLAMLLMLLAPIFSAVLAWVFLGETLLFWQIMAILVTMGGIGWAVSENQPSHGLDQTKHRGLGILLGIGGAVGQAAGLLLSKLGMAGGLSPISANHIRVTAAAIVITGASILGGKLRADILKMKDVKSLLQIGSGALIGPVLGVILSLVAIRYTQIGIASTLMSLSPILLIPVGHFLFKEHITIRTVAGTIVALSGAIWLFFL
ncbi:MAG: DMT family transporter [Acidobacteria bacterium]|jgi:drug/metabolite transporter (DMT)-like permease|nr:DMT family transporter [Acidobacteriota bacterium]